MIKLNGSIILDQQTNGSHYQSKSFDGNNHKSERVGIFLRMKDKVTSLWNNWVKMSYTTLLAMINRIEWYDEALGEEDKDTLFVQGRLLLN